MTINFARVKALKEENIESDSAYMQDSTLEDV